MQGMNLAPFAPDILANRLRLLTRLQRVAFVGSCGERLLSVYDAFARQSKCRENTEALRQGIDLIWICAIGDDVDALTRRAAEDAVQEMMPDPDQIYQSPFATMASDSVQVVLNGIRISDRDIQQEASVAGAVDSAISCQTVVDLYLALVNVPEYGDMNVKRLQELNRINYSVMPMFKAELEKQEHDLCLLESTDLVGIELVQALKEFGFHGISPVSRFML